MTWHGDPDDGAFPDIRLDTYLTTHLADNLMADAQSEPCTLGTGGIETKIQAAEKTTPYGIPLLLTNGGKENVLSGLLNGSITGTLFVTN